MILQNVSKCWLSKSTELELIAKTISYFSYQRISWFILIDSSNSGPVKVLQQSYPWQIERVLRWHDAEEIRERFLGEHRMGVRVRQLEIEDKEDSAPKNTHISPNERRIIVQYADLIKGSKNMQCRWRSVFSSLFNSS